MAGQVIQEVMNDDKSRKAAALRSQEAQRLMRMQEAEVAQDDYL